MWRTRGHEGALERLKRALAGGSTTHAYLLTGPARVGKATLARELAMALNCTAWQGEARPSLFDAVGEISAGEPAPCYQCPSCLKVLAGAHPDVMIVEQWVAARTPIIDQVRAIQYASGLLPYEGRWKVYVLLNAEDLTLPAQNALLKTLEEPAETVRLILTAPSAQSLLPTVVSRCQQIALRPVGRNDIAAALRELREVEEERSRFLATVANGRLGWALEAAGDDALLQAREAAFGQLRRALYGDTAERFRIAEELAAQAASRPEATIDVLQLWLGWLRDLLLLLEGCGDLIGGVDQSEALTAAAEELDSRAAQSCIQALQRAIAQTQSSTNTRLALEVLMLRLPSLRAAAFS
ncbi:MAG: hypothetical protein KGJ86_03770 [Chloroflexota bacterium]|nr:hypothetical protein [Chloroflexota bacterium]